MTDDEPSGPLLGLVSRVEEALAVLRSERAAGKSGELGTLFDATVQSISETMARWKSGSTLHRFMGGLGRDVLTRQGSAVELHVTLGPLAQLGAERARFYVGGEQLAEVPVVRQKYVSVRFDAPKLGLFPVELELLRSSGAIISPRRAHGVSSVHVVGTAPVVLVDGQLVLERSTAELEPLRALGGAGLVLAYFDVAEAERSEAIREAVKAHGLPAGAVLVHPAEDVEIETLGIDFRRVFAVTQLRRLLGRGVPVVSLVSTSDFDAAALDGLGVSPETLGDLEVARVRGEGTQRFEHRARSYELEREQKPELTFRLDYASNSQLVPGNRVQLELDNQAARERLFRAVQEAQHRIHLQFYMLTPSRFSESLVVRLIRAARRGVRVRLVVDALYSGEKVLGRSNPLVTSLEAEPGVEVVASAPIERAEDLEMRALKRRDHRKLAVFDGRIAFVSGRNAGDEYYTGFREVPIHDHTPHERIPWLDAHVEVEGPLVRVIDECFLEAFLAHGGTPPSPLPAASIPPATPGHAQVRLVVHHGTEDAFGLAQYEAMIDCAQRHIYVVNDFPIVSSLVAALTAAKQRGVRVKLLTGNGLPRRADGTFFPGPLHRELFELMMKERLEPLIQSGVEVFECVVSGLPDLVARGGVLRPYVHAKLLTVDGRAASIGSANLDVTASYWEHETNVVVEDEAFTQGVESALEGLIAEAKVVNPSLDYWKREATVRAIVSRLWPESMYS